MYIRLLKKFQLGIKDKTMEWFSNVIKDRNYFTLHYYINNITIIYINIYNYINITIHYI